MADPITWYLLPKKIDDLTTIEEEIDAKILQHNLDPSAHGQDNEAIYMHRISEVLDHVNYSIYNIKLHPATRPIKAFVDAGGAAEFTNIQEAIDYVNALGGGKIFIKAGTYYLDSDINLYSNIYIEGEDRDSVILDFQYNDARLRAEGTTTERLHNIKLENIQITRSFQFWRGYIEFTKVDDADIVNCKFIDNKSPQYANVSDLTITDCTQINIKNNYFKETAGPSIEGQGNNIYIEDNYFFDTEIHAINVGAGEHITIKGNYIDNMPEGAFFIEAESCIIEGNYIKNVISASVWLYGQNNIFSNNIIENSQGLIAIENLGKCIITGNIFINITGEAIYLYDGEGYLVANNLVYSADTGISIDEYVWRSIITGNYLRGATTPLVNNGNLIEIGHNIT